MQCGNRELAAQAQPDGEIARRDLVVQARYRFLVSKIWNSCQSETQLTFWDRPATTPTVDMEEGTGGSRLFQPRFLSGTRRREGFQDAHAGVGRQARYTEGSSVVHKCSR
jgi:hypothetical protein